MKCADQFNRNGTSLEVDPCEVLSETAAGEEQIWKICKGFWTTDSPNL